MAKVKNPIIPGFNPDPSIIRVGDDYYIATSTFEWFPGVLIYHSRDLANWELISKPLNRVSQLNMIGNPSSCGIWAPCLSYDDGIFYLVYTDVKNKSGLFKDMHNYLVTSKNITDDWSEPIYLNSSGFDPSLFHDDDGKKYLVNMIWDHRTWKNSFAGIVLQEYSRENQRLEGPVTNIFKGTHLGKTEAPHIYKHNGYYYLMTAEGGTEHKHAVTIARSKQLTGAYEVDPKNPMLTSVGNPNLLLQKSGHASLVNTPHNEWYIVHLCGRPLPTKGRCVLGRETAIQKVCWTDDGWLRLEDGGCYPAEQVEVLGESKKKDIKEFDDFDSNELNIHYQSLRVPLGEDTLSLKERKGYLRLKGRESLSSLHNQSLIARRQCGFIYTASTCIEYKPDNFQQMAGLICMYDTTNYYYLHITHDENMGKCINILVCDNSSFNYPLTQPISINNIDRCYLKVEVYYDNLQFLYSVDKNNWQKIGGVFDASTLSDEYFNYVNQFRFTGAFVGLCCQDISGTRKHADFDYFEYIQNDEDYS